MKTKMRYLFLLLLSGISMIGFALPVRESSTIQSLEDLLITPQAHFHPSTDLRRAVQRASAAGKLTVRMVYDEEVWTPLTVTVFNKDFFTILYIDDLIEEQEQANEKVVIDDLPEGTYDVLVMMANNDSGARSFVVKENTNVKSQINTNVIANIENVERINCTAFLPDGEEMTLRTLNEEEELVNGNAEAVYIQTYIYKEGIEGPVCGLISNAVADIPEMGLYGKDLRDIFISPVGPHYTIVQVFEIHPTTTQENLGVAMFTRGMPENMEMSNDPSTYTPGYIPPMQLTPALKDFDGNQIELFGVALAKNGVLDDYFNSWSWGRKPGYSSRLSYSSNYYTDSFDSEYSLFFHNNLDMIKKGSQFPSNRAVHSPAYSLSQEGAYFPQSFYRSDNSYYCQVDSIGEINMASIPGNAALSVSSEEMYYVMGESTPFYQILQYNCPAAQVGDDIYSSSCGFLVKSLGRLGETRDDDLGLSAVKVYQNGKPVNANTSFANLWKYLEERGELKGKFRVEFRHENVEIDGVKGFVEQTMNWNQDNEDNISPCLQMVQFRTVDNKLTDFFETATDVTIRFAADDLTTFRILPELSGYVFWDEKGNPFDAKVEWRPNGDDGDWHEISLDKDNENSRQWGFGEIFNGSFETIDIKSKNGWYDVRISLKDEAGNAQVQTLSPAFKIENMSLGKIDLSNAEINKDMKYQIWSLDGVMMKSGLGDIDFSGLGKGIYIIRQGSNVTKSRVP